MRRLPPPFATWMLEHLTSGDRDEALAGDLLEEFHGGRTDGWYWRQVLVACAVSWLRRLHARLPLLVFTLVWSLLAPAWKVLFDRIMDSHLFASIWQMTGFGPLPLLFWLVVWMVINSTFLWAGIVVYISSQRCFGRTFHKGMLRRAFLLAPFILPPAYFVTFVLGNLYWYSFFTGVTLSATPMGQITDLRLLADVIRIPYFVALLCALWGAAPQSMHTLQPLFAGSTLDEPSAQTDSLELVSSLDPFTVRRFFGLMVVAGLINATIVAILLCRLPDSHAPTFTSLLVRAVTYVVLGVLAGGAGTWLYWKSPASPFREHSPVSFPLFALVCASGWVWTPSMALFSEQASAAGSLVAAISAYVLVSGMQNATNLVLAPAQSGRSIPEQGDAELFAESLYRSPAEAHGYVIAIGLYAAGAALFTRSNYTAAALLALCASLFAWKRTLPHGHGFEKRREYKQAALRLSLAAIHAVLLTVWALLDGVAHRNHAADSNAALTAVNGTSTREDSHTIATSQSSPYGIGGYESLILWPIPEKKQIVAPLSVRGSFLAPGTTRPLIIPFDGAYWYVQPPDKRPGRAAHQAHGTPLGAEIESNNSVPLVMDAHQILSTVIPVARCREIQVAIENRDNRAGIIAMAVVLKEAGSPKGPALYLGQQPIASTEPSHFSIKVAPVFETLRFSIPSDAKLRKFSEITVMLLPDIEHAFVAPKIAIQQFQLFPR